MTFRFVHDESLRWVDLDAMGVVNNAVYLTLFEQARFGYFHSLGLLRGDGFPFVLGQTTVRFEKPVRGGRKVVIGVRTVRLGGRSFDQDYEVRDGTIVVATGLATLVCVDEQLRSMPIPDLFRSAVASFEDIPPGG